MRLSWKFGSSKICSKTSFGFVLEVGWDPDMGTMSGARINFKAFLDFFLLNPVDFPE